MPIFTSSGSTEMSKWMFAFYPSGTEINEIMFKYVTRKKIKL